MEKGREAKDTNQGILNHRAECKNHMSTERLASVALSKITGSCASVCASIRTHIPDNQSIHLKIQSLSRNDTNTKH